METNSLVNKSFAAWAKSFSGCDGGNPNGPIWFCGIEFGGEKKPDFKVVIETIPLISETKIRDKFLKYQYNRGVLKLYSLIHGESLSDYKKVFQKHNVFNKNSDAFKLNLYPVPFKKLKSPLPEDIKSSSGFANKKIYLEWCHTHRFPIIKQWFETYKPEIIICTSIKKANSFKKAFLGDNYISYLTDTMIINGKEMQWVKDPLNNTIIFIIPFLGRGGLMKNSDIEAFGKVIADIYSHISKKTHI